MKKFVRLPVVIERTGLSASTIWRLRKVKRFPQPYQTSSGTVAWLESDVEAWIAGIKKKQ